MSSRVRVEWKGDEVKRTVDRAQQGALSETADLAISHARSTHPAWQSITGRALASIKHERVRDEGGRTIVRLGSLVVPYGAKLERLDHTVRRAIEGAIGGFASRVERRIR